MKIQNEQLIKELTTLTKAHLKRAKEYQAIPIDQLNWKANPKKWSVLECLEHLNLYGDFYLPEMQKRITNGKQAAPSAMFSSGWLGNYFAKSMLPKEKLNTMNAPSGMNPVGSTLNETHLERFIEQQEVLLKILEQARTIDLTKTKTSISLASWIKLRLGDTLRVVIYHNERHIVQADKVLTDQDRPEKAVL